MDYGEPAEYLQIFFLSRHEPVRTMAHFASLPKDRYRDSRLIQFGVCRRCVDWMRRGLWRFAAVLHIIQNPFHDGRVFDAGDHLDGAAAHCSQVSISILNKRLHRKHRLEHLYLGSAELVATRQWHRASECLLRVWKSQSCYLPRVAGVGRLLSVQCSK